MSLKIYILEDNKERISSFKKLLIGHDVFISDNVKDFISRIEKEDQEIDLMFLDHDLGDMVYVDVDNKNTGSEVSRWLSKNKKNINNIIIHSLNTVGQKYMFDYLHEYYNVQIIPFIWLKNVFDKFVNIE